MLLEQLALKSGNTTTVSGSSCAFMFTHGKHSPGHRASVSWSIVPQPKGHWLDPWSGHMPGCGFHLQLGRGHEADQYFSLTSMSLSTCLPSPSLSNENKINLKKKKRMTSTKLDLNADGKGLVEREKCR